LGNALHDYDDRMGSHGRGAPHLIVDQRSAGERKKSAQLSDIIFLIGSDESADSH